MSVKLDRHDLVRRHTPSSSLRPPTGNAEVEGKNLFTNLKMVASGSIFKPLHEVASGSYLETQGVLHSSSAALESIF